MVQTNEHVLVEVEPFWHRLGLAASIWRDVMCARAGIVDRKYGKGYVQKLSYVYEISVAKYFNLFPHLVAGWKADPVDLIMYDVMDVDVKGKSSTYHPMHVPVKRPDKLAAVFVLVTGTKSPYRIIGWAWRWDVIHSKKIQTDTGSWMYEVEQYDLQPMEDFPKGLEHYDTTS